MENTMKILSFSYYDLPSHLRTCLLYLSIFPEDYVIEKELLVRRWIAEGFVHKEHTVGLFEIGEGYFNELINRSMILPVEYGNQGVISGCTVHDMVLDLLRSLSREENFVTILDNETLSQSNSRRLALQKRRKNVEHSLQDNMGMQQVRSVNATWCYTVPPLVNFRVLRVLSIEHCDFMEEGYRLGHLGNLLHLRYLGLIHTVIRELPKEIGNLKFLQTLDLRGTGLQELPQTAGLLRQLVWLRVDQKTRVPQDLIGKLTSLEELWILPADDAYNSGARSFFSREPGARSFVKELGNLKELRVLRLRIDELGDSVERDLVESLRNMHKIQFLQIMGASVWESSAGLCMWEAIVLPRHLRYLDLSCIWFSRLPAWINSSHLPSLSYLSMTVHVVREQDLQVLGMLPQLCILHLLVRYGLGANIIRGDVYFQKLRFCKMRCTTLRFVPSLGAPTMMPSLEDLQFGVDVRGLKDANIDCGKLGLESLPSLRRVKVEINCEDASVRDVEEAEAMLKHAADTHPNRPTLELIRRFEDAMILQQLFSSIILQFQRDNDDDEEEQNDE
uniref:NB-ARC domain-containing protein n=1 Tax=Arundo donax TaxID=35708 RepID=A0A0A9ACI4_ARUDO